MKCFSSIIAALSIVTLINVASANEYTPGQICQVNDPTTVSYGWTSLYAVSSAYGICPVTRTYSSVNTARAYVSCPSGSSVSGYVNFVSLDGNYSNFNSTATPTTGGSFTMNFSAINTGGYEGFVNFELNIPAGATIRGFYSN